MPDLPEHAFDMTTLVEALVDESVYLEVGERIGGALVCAFARIGGMPVGIVANQSLVGSGAIDADAARKAARSPGVLTRKRVKSLSAFAARQSAKRPAGSSWKCSAAFAPR